MQIDRAKLTQIVTVGRRKNHIEQAEGKLHEAGGKTFLLADLARINEAPYSLLRGIIELNFEDFLEVGTNPVAGYGECSSS